MDIVHRESPRPPSLAQCLQRHVESDLVPVLEHVRKRLGDAVDLDRLSFDPVRLDPLGQSLAAESVYPQTGPGQCRAAGPTVQRDPHLMWKLSADFMESQSRHEADDGCRDGGRHKSQAMVFGDWRIGQPVTASRYAFEGAGLDESAQRLGMDAGLGDLAPRDGASAASKAQHQARRIIPGRHVAKCIHLLITVNTLPPLQGAEPVTSARIDRIHPDRAGRRDSSSIFRTVFQLRKVLVTAFAV